MENEVQKVVGGRHSPRCVENPRFAGVIVRIALRGISGRELHSNIYRAGKNIHFSAGKGTVGHAGHLVPVETDARVRPARSSLDRDCFPGCRSVESLLEPGVDLLSTTGQHGRGRRSRAGRPRPRLHRLRGILKTRSESPILPGKNLATGELVFPDGIQRHSWIGGILTTPITRSKEKLFFGEPKTAERV